ncbi:hypothetical protein GCM10017612_24950 [Novosphingobium resinovorum]|uniref:hypothetical protein n=2 Tax=Sphingomonadaceae TaxID=41297 RepID=UPI00232A0364|nr:hypothetical protein [Novosphingobium sp. fls2-241-R2A-195]GLK44575.1 hypothetical protein GCM10017612_24950 [Novosphingobium resinovorum]
MSDPRLTIMEAITTRRFVEARYNGAVIRLAPHLMFERRGDLFICALNPEKAIRSDEEPKLGQFKLAGLADATLTSESFELLPSFEGSVPREEDVAILSA